MNILLVKQMIIEINIRINPIINKKREQFYANVRTNKEQDIFKLANNYKNINHISRE